MPIPFVLELVSALEPGSILDVGAGFGKWGFLCRCQLTEGLGLSMEPDQSLRIDAIEAFKKNISQIYPEVYNNTYEGDARLMVSKLGEYDVVICGDMIEHVEKSEALQLLEDMKNRARHAVIVILPLGECPQGAVYGNEYEVHRSTWNKEDFAGSIKLLHAFSFKDGVRIGVAVIPVSEHARWLVKTMASPLRLFLVRRFPEILRKLRRLTS
ncbi:MAG: hypothetical protein A2283_01910 [Lentisphaerae bacterium RIFOXYA12_FULL_48_11]|nr:MAG: hypothetical protein A2283_01910 [Lentisphaerae bacterium RIFOXYA12_FULL_48_11]